MKTYLARNKTKKAKKTIFAAGNDRQKFHAKLKILLKTGLLF